MGALIAAGLWGLAEATFFFLVPDVLLSGVAVLDWPLALRCCGASVAGAVLGGAWMYRLGLTSGRVDTFLLKLPGISPVMLKRVAAEVASRRYLAVLLGPLSGTPYKLYAVEAGRQRLPFWRFILVSVPARGIRFVAVTLLAAWLAHGLMPAVPDDRKLLVWLLAWGAFYAWYFSAMRRAAR